MFVPVVFVLVKFSEQSKVKILGRQVLYFYGYFNSKSLLTLRGLLLLNLDESGRTNPQPSSQKSQDKV